MQRYCFALDLVNEENRIAEYEKYHRQVWPEIESSIRDAGISRMEIYRTGNRLFMIMETEEGFSFEKKAAMDKNNPRVQEWEKLMWQYQAALPWGRPGEKWVLMQQIFNLEK